MASLKSITRKAALKALSGIYRRADGFELDRCAYCGDYRQALDHVPPLVYAFSYLDINEFRKKGGSFLLYPCCNYCNEILSDKKILNYHDRLLYLWDKYAKLITEKSWSDEELNELGYNLKTIILEYERDRHALIKKLRGIETSISLVEL